MCIFCKIVEKQIPSEILYEDESVLAFLDISQVTKGHTLVIPKQHFDNFLTCDPDILCHVMEVSQKIGQHLTNELQTKGMNILSNVNAIAGQSIPHFHIHLIPRFDEHDACVIEFKDSSAQDIKALRQQLLRSIK